MTMEKMNDAELRLWNDIATLINLATADPNGVDPASAITVCLNVVVEAAWMVGGEKCARATVPIYIKNIDLMAAMKAAAPEEGAKN